MAADLSPCGHHYCALEPDIVLTAMIQVYKANPIDPSIAVLLVARLRGREEFGLFHDHAACLFGASQERIQKLGLWTDHFRAYALDTDPVTIVWKCEHLRRMNINKILQTDEHRYAEVQFVRLDRPVGETGQTPEGTDIPLHPEVAELVGMGI